MKVGITQYMECGHFLPGHPSCGSPHGHTYRVDVAVEGPVLNGMVKDFQEVEDKTWEVLSQLDHKNLNPILDVPSCENICLFIYDRLKKILPELESVRVWEGRDKWSQIVRDRNG